MMSSRLAASEATFGRSAARSTPARSVVSITIALPSTSKIGWRRRVGFTYAVDRPDERHEDPRKKIPPSAR